MPKADLVKVHPEVKAYWNSGPGIVNSDKIIVSKGWPILRGAFVWRVALVRFKIALITVIGVFQHPARFCLPLEALEAFPVLE